MNNQGHPKHWLSMFKRSSGELQQLVQDALKAKTSGVSPTLSGKTLGLLFFNPSLRTKVSFEVAAFRLGANVVSLTPGQDTWNFEVDETAIMNADKAEHICEMIRVLSRYCDVLGVRSFGNLNSLEEDAQEKVISAFEKYATVPVINLESAMEHPCQALADMCTLKECFGDPQGKKFVLSWAPHIKPLPLAVPHSALLAAAHSGMNITIAHPQGYDLHPLFIDQVASVCGGNNCRFEITQNQTAATTTADCVYVKSWGAPSLYGNRNEQLADFEKYKNWCLTTEHLGANTKLMHCLPVRRGVVATKEVLTGPASIIIDQAENRLWAQIAILQNLFKEN